MNKTKMRDRVIMAVQDWDIPSLSEIVKDCPELDTNDVRSCLSDGDVISCIGAMCETGHIGRPSTIWKRIG